MKTAHIYKIGKVWMLEVGNVDGSLNSESIAQKFDSKPAAKKAAKEAGLKPWNY